MLPDYKYGRAGSPVSYARHAVWNRDGGQTVALIESPLSYTRHAVGNRDGGQAAAFSESIVSYTLHAVGNDQIGYFAPIQIQMSGISKRIGTNI